MAFPNTPRVIPVELFVVGLWVDITSDVYVRGGVTISRGRKDEQSRAEPSSCSLILDNRSGNYSPRNPVGAFYGSLGRNTPIRIGVQLASDTFGRTVSSGWGTSDTGQTYTFSGVGGTVTSANVNVAAGVGTIALTSTNITRTMVMNGLSLQDVDVSETVTVPYATVTGAAIYHAIRLRDQGSTNYYYTRMLITTTGAIQLEIRNGPGATLASTASIPGLTYSGQSLSIRFQAEGQTLRAKVWDASLGEPYGWNLTVHDTFVTGAGQIGVFSGVSPGNTNTLPIVASYDNLTVRVPRFIGEVAAWPQRWDLSGNDVYVPIQAAGITRRLGQGGPAATSILRRYFTTLATPPVAYWPMEDAKNFGSFASGLPGGKPFNVTVGPSESVKFASYSGLPASAPLPTYGSNTITGSYWSSDLTSNAVISQIQFSFMLNISSGSAPADRTRLMEFHCTGTNGPGDFAWCQLNYRSTGGLELWLLPQIVSGAAIYTDNIFFDYLDANVLVQVQFAQVGAGVTAVMQMINVGSSITRQFSASAASFTLGTPLTLFHVYTGGASGVSAGHLAVRLENVSASTAASAINGNSGETTVARMLRDCADAAIPFSYVGDSSASMQLGPQDTATVLDQLNETADGDLGELYESKGEIGLAYRTRSSMYSQAAALNLDYSAGQVALPLEPVDDDQQSRNDITVNRLNGLNAEAELTVGRMSTQTSDSGGIGPYPTTYTLNVYSDNVLPSIAEWLLAVGTVDEARYPAITVNLANPNVVAAALGSDALSVDIGDCLTVSNPKTGTTPDQIRQIVRGYTETLNVFTHKIQFNCTPESPYRVGKYDATPLFRYDSVTSTLVSGVTSSATSISVANIGEPWTTDPTQMPIPILISGELMNVTAVSGASTPQTFTVVRAVNGVAKAQLAGAVVQIYPVNSATYAL